jgi:hypothetical protein
MTNSEILQKQEVELTVFFRVQSAVVAPRRLLFYIVRERITKVHSRPTRLFSKAADPAAARN